jgi:hypothetical protein
MEGRPMPRDAVTMRAFCTGGVFVPCARTPVRQRGSAATLAALVTGLLLALLLTASLVS